MDFKLKTNAEFEAEEAERLKNPQPKWKAPQADLDKFDEQLGDKKSWGREPTKKKKEICTLTVKIQEGGQFIFPWALLERVKNGNCYSYKMPLPVLIEAAGCLPFNNVDIGGFRKVIDFNEEPYEDFRDVIDAKITELTLTEYF